MMRLRGVSAWLRALRLGRGVDPEFDEELESHVALHVDDNLRAGMPLDEARRHAMMRLGGLTSIREARRDARPFSALVSLTRDVRHGLRLWRRQPVFTAIAVVSLALGIGANTAIFSLVDRVMLRALPVHEPERLAVVGYGDQVSSTWSYPAWTELREYEALTGGIAAMGGTTPRTVTVDGRAMRSHVQMVSGSFYEVLGVAASLGRALDRRDDEIDSAANDAVAVISDRYWRARFNAAPGIVGQHLTIDLVPFTIVGVMPAGFDGVNVGASFDVAVPLAAEHVLSGQRSRLEAKGSWWLQVLLRLRPEQSVDAAAAALRGVQPQIRAATVPDGGTLEQHLPEPFGLTLIPGGLSGVRTSYGSQLLLLMAAVALVLLIACANLAGLLLARAAARRHEMALRLSLGASRQRLIGQMFVESALLAIAGAALGLLVAHWTGQLLIGQIQTINMPVVLDLSLDWRVLSFTLAATLLTTTLFSTGPALLATRSDPGETLKEHTRTLVSRGHTFSALGFLLVQIALSFVLAVGAGLFLRTLAGLVENIKGVDIDRVLIARVYLTPSAVDVEDQHVLFDRLLAAARDLPGVVQAAVSSVTPVQAATMVGPIDVAGGIALASPPRDRSTFMNLISPGFFDTYGTARLAGRDFTRGDTASTSSVAVVNQAFVQRFLSSREDVIGLTVVQGGLPGSSGLERTIVGVVENATYIAPQERALPILYVPMAQSAGHGARGAVHVSVRAAGGNPEQLARPLAEALARTSSGVTVDTHSLNTQVRSALTRQRLLASISSALAGLALLLSGIGLYGAIAYAVTQRRREIGVRTALGATPATVVRLIVARVGVTLVLALAVGAFVARWAAQFVEALLFGVIPTDPATFALAAGTLLLIGATAALVPAWRAARTSPATVLRDE